ncbi:response regulator [Sorangium sp. So ce1024]|uniref:response regulator n=1 Tax=unclassified Sorangium TaxID=2621164 RepID=UPI003F001A99
MPSSRSLAARGRRFRALPADEAGAPPSASPASRTSLSAALSAPVLVIDDSDIARDEVSRVLRAAGFQVVALPSPIGATQAIVRQKARVVVVDVFMPTLRGDRLLTLFRKNQRLEHLGVILMSGHSERELDPLQLELQADAVVAKRHLDRLPAIVKRLAARER